MLGVDLTMTATFAHGIGVRGDLPLPVWMFAYMAAAALLISFIVLSMYWSKPKFEGRCLERPLPSRLQPVARFAALGIRLLGLVLFGVVLAASLFGELGPNATIAPVAVYVAFWVGLLLFSAVFGDVWRLLSPWETIASAGAWVRRRFFARVRPSQRWRPTPSQSGWVAAAALLAFAALELVHPNPSGTRLLGAAILGYSVLMLTAASLWGKEWLREGEGFGVIFRHIGAMGVFCADASGRLAVRPPIVGLAGMRVSLPHAFVILIVPATTSFDGISRTDWWQGLLGARIGWETVGFGAYGLIQSSLNFAVFYIAAMAVGAALTKTPLRDMLTGFAHSLVPIALAYHVGHYFSLMVFEGQNFLTFLSRPFGGSADLFGTSHFQINYRLLAPAAIAWVQSLTTLFGHLAGVVLAHDRAVARFAPREALRSQVALMLVMVGLTVAGMFLLLNA